MNFKAFVLGLALFVALLLGALTGMGVPGSTSHHVPAAYADECDGPAPKPDPDSPCFAPTPTPTPY